MSIVIETFLICDGHCGCNFGVDDRTVTGNKQRYRARFDDWHFKEGKDYCPECWSKMQHESLVRRSEMRKLINRK